MSEGILVALVGASATVVAAVIAAVVARNAGGDRAGRNAIGMSKKWDRPAIREMVEEFNAESMRLAMAGLSQDAHVAEHNAQLARITDERPTVEEKVRFREIYQEEVGLAIARAKEMTERLQAKLKAKKER
jgi:hypothetical protein